MFGKWVIVELGEGIRCEVFVLCNPNTLESELQDRALNQLRNKLENKKEGIWGLGDAIQKIDDYNYQLGLGTRYEMEKRLEKLLEEMKS